jgi:hypothetical protein
MSENNLVFAFDLDSSSIGVRRGGKRCFKILQTIRTGIVHKKKGRMVDGKSKRGRNRSIISSKNL